MTERQSHGLKDFEQYLEAVHFLNVKYQSKYQSTVKDPKRNTGAHKVT